MIGGRYRKVRVIGRGGMGEVFLAEDTLLDREVAVKHILRTDEDETTAAQRLLREARSAARIHHPNVVAVHDLVVEGDDAYIVMEYVPAENLAQILRRGPITPERAARIGAQVADALAAAHRLGIVHRDVKPSNILVEADDRAKLMDFGIARTVNDATLTRTGHMIGSVAYMAPEVARGEAVTPAADLHSLGATLFAAVEGHSPFAGQDDSSTSVAMLVRLVTETAPPATKAGPLTDLIARLLSPDPEARPDAAEAAAGLRSAAGGAASPAPAASGANADESRFATVIRPPALPVVAQAAPVAGGTVADEEVAATPDRSRPGSAPASGPSPVDDRTVLRQPAPATPVAEVPPAAAKVEPPASARPGEPVPPTAPSPTPNQKKNGRRRKVLAVATPLVILTALGVAVFASRAGGTQEATPTIEATTSAPTSHGLPTPAGDASSIQDPSPSTTAFNYKSYAGGASQDCTSGDMTQIGALAHKGKLIVTVGLSKRLDALQSINVSLLDSVTGDELSWTTVDPGQGQLILWVSNDGGASFSPVKGDLPIALGSDIFQVEIPLKLVKPTHELDLVVERRSSTDGGKSYDVIDPCVPDPVPIR